LESNIFYLLRHAHTPNNTKTVLTGIVDSGISCDGITESLLLRDAIRDEQLEIDEIIGSKSARADHTSKISLGINDPVYVNGEFAFKETEIDNLLGGFFYHPILVDPEGEPLTTAKIRYDNRLMERSYGILAGIEKDKVAEWDTGGIYGGLSPVIAVDLQIEDGESGRDKYNQVVELFAEFEAGPKKRRLISSHAATLGFSKLVLQGKSLDSQLSDRGEIDFQLIQPPHAKIEVYEKDGANYRHTRTIG
jgi:broad specificity phosphatase PhoE